jgi:hypothetical protein
MKTYEFNGRLYRFAEDKVPDGAVLHISKKPEPVTTDEPKTEEVKAKKPSNKSRKKVANK